MFPLVFQAKISRSKDDLTFASGKSGITLAGIVFSAFERTAQPSGPCGNYQYIGALNGIINVFGSLSSIDWSEQHRVFPKA